MSPDFETHETGTHRALDEKDAQIAELRRLVRVGLEIWDEYMSQIGTCVSQDYGRLNQFPIDAAAQGIKLDDEKESQKPPRTDRT